MVCGSAGKQKGEARPACRSRRADARRCRMRRATVGRAARRRSTAISARPSRRSSGPSSPHGDAAEAEAHAAGGGSGRGCVGVLRAVRAASCCGWRSPRRCRSRSSRSPRPRSPCSPPTARRSRATARSSTSRSRSAKLPPHVAHALHRDRGPAVLPPLGRRPARDRPRRVERPDHRPHRGRQHDHPAARQVHLPVAQADARPQGARGADRVLARGLADQGPDPRTLPVERLFRRQHLWPARRLAALLLPPAGEADARAGGDARRAAAGADRAIAPTNNSKARQQRDADRCCRRWSRPVT